MRWSWLLVLAACSRPPAPKCPVCAPPPAAAKAEPVAEDPLRLVRACVAVELGVKNHIQSLQLLAHQAIYVSRILKHVEAKQPRAIQNEMERTMSTVVNRRPSWAVLTYPLNIAASSPNPLPLDVLTTVHSPEHTASLVQVAGEWTLLVGTPVSALDAGAFVLMWQPADFKSELSEVANATVTIADKVDADVRGTSCQELDAKRMAIKVGAGYVIVEVR